MRSFRALIGLSCWLLSTTSIASNKLENIRISPAPHETRVVIDLSEQASYDHFVITESKPFRLVVDLKNTDLSMTLPKDVSKSKILSQIRPSRPPEEGTFRLVFDLNEEVLPRLFHLSPAGAYGHRIVINLPHEIAPQVLEPTLTEKSAFDAAPLENSTEDEGAEITKGVFDTQIETLLPFGNEDIVIAIDPGHGGRDPGAVGPQRKFEKHVTLAIAQHIADSINGVRGMKAVLTRNGDYSVRLNRRTEIARDHRAHFLISVHADGFNGPEPKGASVWVLSKNRANSEIGRWIERHEQRSELLGGGNIVQQYQDEHIRRAIFDLQFSNSHREGYNVALEVLNELGKVTQLHKSSPEFASLAVLKAPDIPSILVEAGFITNPEEEVLLFDSDYQEKIANAVYLGVRGYFERFPPDGTLFSAMKNGVKHKVKDGESLSFIADKYRTTVEDIMRMNNLSSDMLVTSQELIIYAAKQPEITPEPLNVGTRHIVQYGEYLGQIASIYGVTIRQLQEMNKLGSDKLNIGQILKIPGI